MRATLLQGSLRIGYEGKDGLPSPLISLGGGVSSCRRLPNSAWASEHAWNLSQSTPPSGVKHWVCSRDALLRYSGSLEQGDTQTNFNRLEQASCPLHLPRGQVFCQVLSPSKSCSGPSRNADFSWASNSSCLSFRLLTFYRTSAQGTWKTALEPFYCCKQREHD